MNTDIDIRHPLLFKTSHGQLYLVDWWDIEQVFDPEGRTVPGRDPNELFLTAEDCVWLWSIEIGA